jgi:glycosyltransferase involved in cell wall biosynthesis
VIASERIFPGSQDLSLLWRFLRRFTYPRADLHLVQTQSIAQWLRDRHFTSRTAVLPNAIPWPLSKHLPQVEPSEKLDPSDKLVLAVGTKPFQKGFDRLIAAFSSAALNRPGWKLAIAGISPEDWPLDWPPLPSGASAPLLLGRVGNLADWYARADLFVLSSRSEGIPNVLLEAMASGCACLAIDCPTGPADLIDHGSNGWLLPADSSSAELSEALEALMGSSESRCVFAERALFVRQRFSVDCVRHQFLKILSPWIHSSL